MDSRIRTVKLREISKKIGSGVTPRGGSESYQSHGIPLIRSQNVLRGRLDISDVAFIDRATHSKMHSSVVRPSDVLLNITGASIGRSCVVPDTVQDANVNQHVCIIRLHEGNDPDYISYFLNSYLGRKQIWSFQGGGSREGLNFEQVGGIKLPLPSENEQRKIAEILRTWDEAIEKLEALRDAGTSRKKGILQYLFGDGIHFREGWEAKPLKDVAERVRRTNDGGDHPIMTISARSGFLLQSDKFARDMAGSSVDRYTQLKQGEFAYNKGNSKTAPYGCIFALDQPTAVVPFVYFCFKLNDELHHPFFTHLFEAGVLNHQLSRLINSGVRNDGLLNLYSEDFFNCRVPVPPHDEQVRIASIITSLNSELMLIDRELEAIQRQKRGMMQKLLTGEWRVNADSHTKEAM